jgi:uncharacterized protein
MIKRVAGKILKQLSREYPVISLTGPRQSGKTTLLRAVFNTKKYVNLENPEIRALAKSDPKAFLNQYKDGVILDEIQKCPELFSWLQVYSDEHKVLGEYIISGSAQFLLNEKIAQSLAGRVGQLVLLPFSFSEIQSGKYYNDVDPYELIVNGFYPPPYDRQADFSRWYSAYINTYIEKDVRQIMNIQNLDQFQNFLSLCAGNTGQLLNYNRLSNDTGVSINTAKNWINLLKQSYICYTLKPYFKNFRKRIVKSPKLYFYDTGLASQLLGIRNGKQLFNHPLRGALFENMIITEYLKKAFNRGEQNRCFFWRSNTGIEIDLLVDRGTDIQPIEIKSGSTFNSDWIQTLKKWQAGKEAVKDPLIIYTGEKSHVVNGVKLTPWTMITG